MWSLLERNLALRKKYQKTLSLRLPASGGSRTKQSPHKVLNFRIKKVPTQSGFYVEAMPGAQQWRSAKARPGLGETTAISRDGMPIGVPRRPRRADGGGRENSPMPESVRP